MKTMLTLGGLAAVCALVVPSDVFANVMHHRLMMSGSACSGRGDTRFIKTNGFIQNLHGSSQWVWCPLQIHAGSNADVIGWFQNGSSGRISVNTSPGTSCALIRSDALGTQLTSIFAPHTSNFAGFVEHFWLTPEAGGKTGGLNAMLVCLVPNNGTVNQYMQHTNWPDETP
jgi:hypothetical protein